MSLLGRKIMGSLPKHNGNETNLEKRLDALITISLDPIKFQESTLKQKIAFFSSLEFDNHEIARILQTTAGVVAKERSLLKKASKNE
jgi:hypothetical protein